MDPPRHGLHWPFTVTTSSRATLEAARRMPQPALNASSDLARPRPSRAAAATGSRRRLPTRQARRPPRWSSGIVGPHHGGEEDAMARWVKVAAAQMGPINEGTSREECVDRMLALLEQAIADHV